MATENTLATTKMGWIASARFDTLFFLFPIVLMFLYYGLFDFLAEPTRLGEKGAAMAVVFVFNAFIDFPHLLSTLVRTHRDEDMKARFPLFFRFEFVVLGLLCLSLIFLVQKIGYEWITVLGVWHIMRQNWGFVRAYAIKNDKKTALCTSLEKASFHVTTAVFMIAPVAKDVATQLWPVCLLVIGAYLLSLLWSGGLRLSSIPRELFYLSTICSLYVVLLVLDVPWILQATVCSVHHDISYLGFVYLYKKKVLKLDRKALMKSFRKIYIVAFIAAVLVMNPLFELFYMIFLLMHFVVDGFIWKFSAFPELKAIFADEDNTDPTPGLEEASA